jgi:hypothetical protein
MTTVSNPLPLKSLRMYRYIIFRYSKGLPRDAIKVGDELLKFLVGTGTRKATADEVEQVARNTLKKKKYKTVEQTI